MGYRDEALAKLDVRAFLSTQGVDVGKKVGTNEYRIRCPNPGHTDAEPSANVNLERGLWHCKACNASGGPIDLLMQRGASYKEALTEIGRLAGMEPPSSAKHTNGAAGTPSPAAPSSVTKSKLTEANVKAWHETGLRNVELQRWFHEHRGFTDETIATYELGWDGTRVTIPVRDTAGSARQRPALPARTRRASRARCCRSSPARAATSRSTALPGRPRPARPRSSSSRASGTR
jgi:DNA primase